jgi:outer membrane lipoprotein-sorting protein
MTPRRGGAAALAVLTLAAAACAPSAPPVTLPPTPIAPSEAAAALEAAEGAVRTLRGLADVRLARGGQQERFREAAVLALPDKLRLETLQFGGASALILAADGDHLAIYSLATKEFAHGRASAGAVAALAGVAVEPRHLVRLLAGLPPLPFQSADPRSRVEPEGAEFVAESAAGPFWQRLRLDAGGGVVGGELRTAAGPVFTFRFEDARWVGGRAFPHRLRLEQPGAGWVDVAYRSVELNPPVDDAIFSLAIPAGDVRVVDLDAARPR